MASQNSQDKEAREIWFLCGPGNNGGDGLVAAAILHEDGEYGVRVFASHPNQKTEIAEAAREHSVNVGVPIHTWEAGAWSTPPPEEGKVILLVDALLGVGPGGTGETAKPRGAIEEVLRWMFSRFSSGAPRVLACDIPTGMGSELQLNAGRTLTFHEEKIGMRNQQGEYVSGLGMVIVAPLPWPDETLNPGPGDALRYPEVEPEAVKGERGRVLIVGGGPFHGAPILAGMAAARMGADLVHVAMPMQARERVSWPTELIPEEISDQSYLTPNSVEHLVERMKRGRRVQAMVIGPGLGVEGETVQAVQELLAAAVENAVPCVVDADAIRSLPKGEWPVGLIGVATPHSAERQAWLGDARPADILANAAVEWNLHSQDAESAVIITTGPSDELVGLAGRQCICSGGDARMAMGGTGDILAGSIGGLIAVGMSPWAASRLATWLLRESGHKAGEQLGPGMVAGDLPQYLAGALATSLIRTQ